MKQQVHMIQCHHVSSFKNRANSANPSVFLKCSKTSKRPAQQVPGLVVPEHNGASISDSGQAKALNLSPILKPHLL